MWLCWCLVSEGIQSLVFWVKVVCVTLPLSFYKSMNSVVLVLTYRFFEDLMNSKQWHLGGVANEFYIVANTDGRVNVKCFTVHAENELSKFCYALLHTVFFSWPWQPTICECCCYSYREIWSECIKYAPKKSILAQWVSDRNRQTPPLLAYNPLLLASTSLY